ncbi:hypothetical protein DBR24_19980 [Pseudomonas sp. HMWF006]|nr:hypothetical protein DBR24_19980 [Pseudomonas sp. HMWF006]PTT63305.1 hypothetical protein DBR26_22960 [Pseudomonas sp. HMWF007]PTT88183.1 hypothetical protein DBR29_18430 [Pseudomonas sp. HMWF005]
MLQAPCGHDGGSADAPCRQVIEWTRSAVPATAPLCQTPQNPVGASLLAKGPCQPTSSEADTPLSRASSLPQGL